MNKFRLIFPAILILTLLLMTQISYGREHTAPPEHRPALNARVTPDKPASVRISPEADILGVIVKFKEKTNVRLRGSGLVSLRGHSLKEVNRLLNPYIRGKLARLFEKPEKALEKAKSVYELASGHELADLNLYYRLDVTDNSEAESLVNQLNKLDPVEIAYVEPRAEPAEDIDPPTPNFEPYQNYLLAAPIGVDAVYANTLTGGDGTGVKIIDIEHNWNESHEDLEKAVGATIGQGNSQDGNHGTAVLGEMVAGDNGYGVTGICPGADVAMVSAAYNGTSRAMLIAADSLERGDLMLIELHAPGPRYNFQVREDQKGYVCMEYWQDKFDALQYAWAKGIIVVEAAGNGAENFDDPIYEQLFDTTYRNSHAVMAGAGAPPSGSYGPDRSRLGFSNYGKRVNLQGYGREVFTTGYGYFWGAHINDPDQYYTSTFSGTSSASPIVTGSIACLQGHYMMTYGVPFDADYARTLFNATGSPQQGDTTEHIGPRPDLAAAVAAMSSPPSLYAEPIYFDTTTDEGNILNLSLWLFNRANSYALDYSIEGNDSLLKLTAADWLYVSPAAGTIPSAGSVELTVTLDATVIESRLDGYKGQMEISWGISGGGLDSITLVPVFLDVPCAPDTTFSVSSSNEPEGPSYGWIEITTIGTMIPRESYYNGFAGNPLDDGSAGPFALPFDLPFYDSSYNQFYVGVNGAISFTESEVNSGGYFSHFSIPGNPMTTLVAPFWNDLVIGGTSGAHGNIYYYHSPTDDTTIIEWYRVGNFNSIYDTLTTFEIILTRNGRITFQYKDVGFTGLENTALIGLNAEECTATPYFENGTPSENTVGNSVAVEFDQGIVYIRAGDSNNDGTINLLDITFLINYLYKGGPAPDPLASGDPNCDGKINLLDITFLISYLYKSGPVPCYYLQ